MGLVVAGRIRVGWPGAPGCTTTGVAESDCCAQTGKENRHASVMAVISPLRRAETIGTERKRTVSMNSFDDVEWARIAVPHFITKGFSVGTSGSCPECDFLFLPFSGDSRCAGLAFEMNRIARGVFIIPSIQAELLLPSARPGAVIGTKNG